MMKRFDIRWAGVAAVMGLGLFSAACGSDSSSATSNGGGGAGGGTTKQTLYAKYGGAPTVKKIVGQAVAGLTSDPKVSPFFAVIGKKGHDSAADLTGCLEAFFTNAMGGPGAYPTKLADGFVCRDMKAAHADLAIDSAAFDEFIMDLGGVLKEDKVEQADINTIAGALTDLKDQVVTAK